MTENATLTLFVTGNAPRSRRARANLADALEALGYMPDCVQEVDVLAHPQVALEHGVFACPALMVGGPERGRSVMYGDLSETEKVRHFLRELER